MLALHCYSGDKKQTTDFFQTISFKESKNTVVKKPQSNDKPLLKTTSLSYHMEQKTFIAVSHTSNIHTGENFFGSCYFCRFANRFFSDKVKSL